MYTNFNSKTKPQENIKKGGYSAPVIHDKPNDTPKPPPPKPNSK